jgi:hypothetical protein
MSREYAEGYRLGLADARTGALTLICGDLRDGRTAQRVAGYQAGRTAGMRARGPGLTGMVGEPEAEAW